MPTNFYMFFVAAIIPFVLGALWYGPLFGKPWMKMNGFTEESLKKGNMAVIFGVSYLLCVLFSMGMASWAIHQSTLFGLFMPEIADKSTEIYSDVVAFYTKYGGRHRTFSHGAVHGIIFAIMFALPIIGVNALFERRSWKYILLHFGYWLVSAALVGGLLCATLVYPAI